MSAVLTDHEFMMRLAPAVVSARETRNMNSIGLATKLDISKVHMNNLEHARKNPSLPLLLRLLDCLDISMDSLLSGSGPDSAPDAGRALSCPCTPTAQEFVARLGPSVLSARKDRKIARKDLAAALDISSIHLKNIEHARKIPSVRVLLGLLTSLDISMDSLLASES